MKAKFVLLLLGLCACVAWLVHSQRETAAPIIPQASPSRPTLDADEPLENAAVKASALKQELSAPIASDGSAFAETDEVVPEEAAEPVRQEPGSSLSHVEHGSLWQAFAQARIAIRELSPTQAAMPHNEDVAYFASQPKNDFTIRFLDDGGVKLESGNPDREWEAIMRVEGTGAIEPVRVDDACIEIPHSDDLVEWYVNKPEGLEHGFTVHSRRADMMADDGLQIRVGVEGMQVHVDPKRPGDLLFKGTAGHGLLGYGGLKVMDGRGMEVAADMWPEGDGLVLAVHDAGASYPLTIDPVVVNFEQNLIPFPELLGAPNERFGASVSTSEDTAVVGVFREDTAAGVNAGSVYVFKRSPLGGEWAVEQKLEASDGTTNAFFGTSVSLLGDDVVVGAPGHHAGVGAKAGKAYVFRRSGSTWTEQMAVMAGDVAEGDLFGIAVGFGLDTMVVGSVLDDTISGDADAGSVYVYSRSGTNWTEQQKLEAFDAAAGDHFGGSVAIDGNAIIGFAILVGANGDEAGAGSAYAYSLSNTTWNLEQKLEAGDAASGDLFGTSVELSHVFGTAIIGARLDDTAAGVDAGSVYVFTRSGMTWTQEQKLEAVDAAAGDEFGSSVHVNGNSALVGAPEDDTGAGVDAGSVYVYSRSGTNWTQLQQLTANDGEAGDHFGEAVSRHAQYALIGAEEDNIPVGANAGSAYVFHSSGGTWSQQQTLYASAATVADNFSKSVSISSDTLAVGTPLDDTAAGADAGSAYVFTRTGTTWRLEQLIEAPDGAASDRFGASVSIDGDSLLVGAPQNSPTNAGCAYVFARSGTVWSQQQKLIADDGAGGDSFGQAVALDGDTALVGAGLNDNENGDNAGAGYVFARSGATWTQEQKLVTSTGFISNDRVGASCALDGNTAVLGVDRFASISARAHIFVRSGATWSQQQAVASSDLESDDRFAEAVSLFGDSLVVGAPNDDHTGVVGAGSAYVFVRTGVTWTEQKKLQAEDAAGDDLFGSDVAIFGDTVVVGAKQHGGSNDGKIYTFGRIGADWLSGLTIDEGSSASFLGISVAMSDDTVVAGSLDGTSAGAASGSVYVYRYQPVTLSPLEIAENQPSNTFVSSFAVGGSGVGWTFSLVSGTGDDDNSIFSIIGSNLLALTVLDHEDQSTRTIRVNADDGSMTGDAVFPLTILDDRTEDADGDGLTEEEEEDIYGTSDDNSDDDGDGIPGGLEVAAELDPAVDNSALVTAIQSDPVAFGVDVDALAMGSLLLVRDPVTRKFRVSFGMQKSTDMFTFVDLFVQPSELSANGSGEIEYIFTSPDSNAFYRVEAR